MTLRKVDFYYGAFLSALLNNAKKKPSLFDDEPTDNRRIYRLTTERSNVDYVIYTKYAVENGNHEDKHRWTFNFSDDEIERITSLSNGKECLKLALICVSNESLQKSEIALIDCPIAMKCLGIGLNIKPYRITVKTQSGKHGIRVYGSGHSDKLNGKDNTFVVQRNALELL